MHVYAYPYHALIVAGVIFGLVALMHLLRLIYKSPVIIAGKTIPIWVSDIGFIFPLILSIWMFMASYSYVNFSSGDPMTLKLINVKLV